MMTRPTMKDGHGGNESISTQSISLTFSLVKAGGCSSHGIADNHKIKPASYAHNGFYLNKGSPHPIITWTPSPNAYTSPPIPSPTTPLDPKHCLHHLPYNDSPNGWDFDDNFINNHNNNTTDIFAYRNSQSVRWGFDDDFIFDLKVKTTMDDAIDATESIVFDNNPNREFDDNIHDSETESTKDNNSPPNTLLNSSSSDESLLDSSYKL